MSDPPTDYLAMLEVDPEDAVQHGIKGMKWGVRTPRAVLRARSSSGSTGDTKKTGSATDHVGAKVSSTKSEPDAPKKTGNIQDNVESSSSRYARLGAEAKGGGASSWTEQDLKFFNARTEALAKVNKMNQADPNWLKETGSKVLKTMAERQMQAVANGIADKYVSGRILDGVNGVKAAAAVAEAAKASGMVPKVTPTKAAPAKVTPTTATKTAGMTPEQTLQYFRDHPAPSSKPVDFSPSGNHQLFKDLKEAGILDDSGALKTKHTPSRAARPGR